VPADVLVWAISVRLIRRLKPDVLHGHGAKAALHPPENRFKAYRPVYTPHGGSLHYPLTSLKGALYSRLERALMNSTDLFLFESAFARDTYQRTIGTPRASCGPSSTASRRASSTRSSGRRRHRRDLCRRVSATSRRGPAGRCSGAAACAAKPVTLTLAGDGEEGENLRAQVARLALGDARASSATSRRVYGFSKGSLLVVPSRGDSMSLCRDRGGPPPHSDGRAQGRRHSRNSWPAARRCAVRPHSVLARWRTRSRLRWKDPEATAGAG